MTERDVQEINADLDAQWPEVFPTPEEMDEAAKAHAEMADRAFTKTRDLLNTDDRMSAFWNLRHKERFDA